MEHCKYKLPCGRCDKYDIPCEMSEVMPIPMTMDTEDGIKECEHTWYLRSDNLHEGDMKIVKVYQCMKCGMTKMEMQDAVTV